MASRVKVLARNCVARSSVGSFEMASMFSKGRVVFLFEETS